RLPSTPSSASPLTLVGPALSTSSGGPGTDRTPAQLRGIWMPPPRGALRSRFLAVARPFFVSEVRRGAFALLALLLLLIFCLNGLNVLANYMGGDFMTAVEQRQPDRALSFALFWAGAFACLTVVAVIKAFTEERLRLWWRSWLTRHLFERYLS